VNYKFFDIPIRTAPKWKFWLARIFGESLGGWNDGVMVKKWWGVYWMYFKERENE